MFNCVHAVNWIVKKQLRRVVINNIFFFYNIILKILLHSLYLISLYIRMWVRLIFLRLNLRKYYFVYLKFSSHNLLTNVYNNNILKYVFPKLKCGVTAFYKFNFRRVFYSFYRHIKLIAYVQFCKFRREFNLLK